MHPLQAMVDGMNAAWQKERAGKQLTLGAMIEALGTYPPEQLVYGVGEPDSYRGYYCDLAFAPTATEEPVSALLQRCRDAMGREFTGYKGGEYVMGESTPVWLADYGSTGDRLMAFDPSSGVLKPVTAPDES